MNNKKPSYIAIILILLIILSILVYFLISRKNETIIDKKDNIIKKTEKKEEVKEPTELTENELEQLAKKIEAYNKGLVRFYPLDNLNKIDNQNLLQFAIITIQSKENDESIKAPTKYDIDNIILEYFGDKTVELSDYICDGDTNNNNCNKSSALYEYDNITYNYRLLEVSRGAYFIQLEDNFVKITSHKFEDDKLIVKAKVVYGTYVDSSTNPPLYYATLEDCKNKQNSIYEREGLEVTEEKKEELLERIEKETTYTFKKVSDRYILQSVE